MEEKPKKEINKERAKLKEEPKHFIAFLEEKKLEHVEQAAFIRFSRWTWGKAVTRDEFEKKWKKFTSKYLFLGGK